MSSTIDKYKKADAPLPDSYLAWLVYGAGFESVGRDGKPEQVSLRELKDNEILCRVDALGLCLSDIKIINQGNNHPRLLGRDLATEPTVLGHEASITVVKVGKQWQGKFNPGERYIVQADIYVDGVTCAFGYRIPGGLQQFCYLDERALDGDDGNYLLPVQPDTGYSQSALSEPWACVEMSYNLKDRFEPTGGPVLIVSDDADAAWCSDHPDAAVLPRSLDGLSDGDKFDDILLSEPTPALVTRLADHLNKGGVMYLLGAPAELGACSLDIGRIHYDDIRFYGGGQLVSDIQEANSRYDLLPQGASIFIGAGGPMGQMHVQRAIEVACGSRTVVVTDLDPSRLDHIEKRFGNLAKAKGVALHCLSPEGCGSQDAMNQRIREIAPNGYSDVCVLAPVPALVTYAMSLAADNALVNVFAGIPIGNPANIELADLCRGIKIIGSSGSRIEDLRKILQMVESSELNTNLSVAAIGGLNVAREGLEGVKSARFPGKTVIYPQIPEMDLIALEDIPKKLPQLADKLDAEGAWTNEAEKALIESMVP